MRHPKQHINYQRRHQIVYTAVFAALLCALIIYVASGCNGERNLQHSRSKFDTYEGPVNKNGQPIPPRSYHHSTFWKDRFDPKKQPPK